MVEVEHVPLRIWRRLVEIWVDHDIEIFGVFKGGYGHGRGDWAALYARVCRKIDGESIFETGTSNPTLNAQTCCGDM